MPADARLVEARDLHVVVGISLPLTPLAASLGFTPLPAAYLAFVAVATATYLALVQLVKARLMSRVARAAAEARSREDA